MLLLLSSCYSNPEDTKKIEELKNKINEQNELLSQYDKIKEDLENTNKSKNETFEKNIICNKYKETIENNLNKHEHLLELFYSSSKNTCIKTTLTSKDPTKWINYFEIWDVITWTSYWFYQCNTDKNCNINFNNKVKELKN